MDRQQETLERLLDEELRRERMWQPARYEVRAQGDEWAIVDCVQDRPHGRVVRVTRWRAIAQSVCIFGNALGRCTAGNCEQPATLFCFGAAVCIDHVPAGEGHALIPLEVLRIWRASEYR
jgi:hypothetical protein